MICNIASHAQVVVNPVFERSDTPAFRIEKVEITQDTTFFYCTYSAEEYSWAKISKETFLLSRETGKKFPLLRCEGIPFSPEKRHFTHSGDYKFLFCFPVLNNIEVVDFIEDPDNKAFNIYGISLTKENDNSSVCHGVEDALSLSKKAEIYNSTGNHVKAIDLETQATNIWKALFGFKSSEYAISLLNLMYCLSCGEEHEKVIRYGEENVLLYQELFGTESDIYASYLRLLGSNYNSLSNFYFENKQFPEALDYANKAVMTLEKLPDYFEDNLYDESLGCLGTCYSINGCYKDALRIGNKRYNMLVSEKGKTCWQTADAALRLSNYYGSLGFYNEKEKYLIEAIDCCRSDSTTIGSLVLATALSNLAMYYIYDNPEKALDLALESYLIREESLGDKSLLTNISLYNLGFCFNEMSKLKNDKEMGEHAVRSVIEAIKNTEAIFGDGDYRLAKMKTIATDIMTSAKRYEDAIKNEEEISSIFESTFGTNNDLYLCSQEKLANLYLSKNDRIKATECANRVIDGYEQYITSNFPVMTSNERANLFYGIASFYDYVLPRLAYYQDSPDVKVQLYNAQLLRKGILLSADMESEHIIKESNDSLLIHNHDVLIANKTLYYKQSQLPIKERTVNLDSLKREISISEEKLLVESAPYRKYVQRRSAKWTDIQEAIDDKDLAIEFVSIVDTCAYEEHYVALAINKESAYPELINLFSESQISELTPKVVPELIWHPILNRFKEVKNIYFSPTGVLNNIGIEYMISNNGKETEDYQVYRLSSTKELLNKRTPIPFKSAVLYGGLSYDDILNGGETFNDPSSNYLNIIYRGLTDSLMSRGGFESLPNTLLEVNTIRDLLKSSNIATTLYTDNKGTEDSFKHLSGKNNSIMHIATHGMYIYPNEASEKKSNNNFRFIQLDNEDVFREDIPLTRSFLVMSGGNMLPHRISIQETMEDGILTALEISSLDFYGLDLVVLSACQTALGDTNKEGVYGLQRAFKKAGTNTILMSLTKVDDNATRILMIEFYKNLIAGKSKHQSLKDAQKCLRQFENGKYDKPEYWASFIMLDGLN